MHCRESSRARPTRNIPRPPPTWSQRYDEAQAKVDKKNTELKRKRRAVTEAKSDADKDAAKAEVKTLQAELDQLKKERPPKYPFIHGLTEGKTIANMKVHLRGNPATLGAEAPRRFLAVLSKPDDSAPFTEGSGRLELARAIASPENPLTARVLVNRVWERHFGRGLVATPSNFGRLGERPATPSCSITWPAGSSPRAGRIKTLHRAIMLSATYQLDSAADDRCAAVDPENTLALAGQPAAAGGRSLARRDARRLGRARSARSAAPRPISRLPENRRRTLYGTVSRHNLDGLLRLFDFPDPNITSDKRTVTTVPLQQLFVLNSPFMQRQAKALAARLTADASGLRLEPDPPGLPAPLRPRAPRRPR